MSSANGNAYVLHEDLHGLWLHSPKDSVSYVDLELDPVGSERGFDHLADEDEFHDAVRARHIDSMEERMALAASRDIQDAMAARREPFGRSGWLALDLVAELGLPATS